MITLSHITKIFDSKAGRVDAVRDVSLNIDDGDIYGIIGFSGAGKSTLVRCINLLEAPTSGTVSVDGTLLTSLSSAKLREARKKIGMIFQHFNLLPSRTVEDNVSYPLKHTGLSKADIKSKVDHLLSLVDMTDKKSAYPSELSGGQKQRVAIARALACDPSVLLCDEATSALDPQTTHSILSLLKKLNETLGITIVLITHQMDAVKEICNHVAVMEAGEVVESGDVYSIFSDPQTDITKEFIKPTSNLHHIDDLIESGAEITKLSKTQRIVRFSYLEKTVSESLVSTISRIYSLDVNIIYSQIEIISGSPLGGLVAILDGTRIHQDEAIEYLRSKNVKVEVIKDGFDI